MSWYHTRGCASARCSSSCQSSHRQGSSRQPLARQVRPVTTLDPTLASWCCVENSAAHLTTRVNYRASQRNCATTIQSPVSRGGRGCAVIATHGFSWVASSIVQHARQHNVQAIHKQNACCVLCTKDQSVCGGVSRSCGRQWNERGAGVGCARPVDSAQSMAASI